MVTLINNSQQDLIEPTVIGVAPDKGINSSHPNNGARVVGARAMGFYFPSYNLLYDFLGGNDGVGDVLPVQRQGKLPNQFLPVRYGTRGGVKLLDGVGYYNGFAATRGHYGHYIDCPFVPRLKTAVLKCALEVS